MKKIYGFIVGFLMLGLISNNLYSNNEFGISDTKLNEINERVQSSSVAELLLIKANLEQEQKRTK